MSALKLGYSLFIGSISTNLQNKVPDWVQGELGSEASSFASSLPYSGAFGGGTHSRQFTGTRERFAASFGSPHSLWYRCDSDISW